MSSFEIFNFSKQLYSAIQELELETPTPVQVESFSVILSGKDVVGIAQTGTGKTFAYLLPILHELKFSKQPNPRILILVPTRELVLQVVEQVKLLIKYINLRVLGVYGGTNINTQKQAVAEGTDILVGTPGRLYDLALTGVLRLNGIKKLIIDEVDIMLDEGFLPQLKNIFEYLPVRRQNLMFSATMTDEVDDLIGEYFMDAVKISIAESGTPLDNISQSCYLLPNFYTKINLLKFLLKDKNEFRKVLVFVSGKKIADKLFSEIENEYGTEACIIHSNKSQNYRIKSINKFDKGENRIMISTDIMARGLDLEKISHVINFDTPNFPENYIHRIGRTGRAEQSGKSILFFTEREEKSKHEIEKMMNYEIQQLDLPEIVEISKKLTIEESERIVDVKKKNRQPKRIERGASFHEKSEKNKKTNQGGSYKREIAKKYKKPKTRGDKIQNLRREKK